MASASPRFAFISSPRICAAHSLIAVAAVSSAASAQVTAVSSRATFDLIVSTLPGSSVLAESFVDHANLMSDSISGGVGDSAWIASASGGVVVSNSVLSTQLTNASLTFSFASSNVFAIGGNFFSQSEQNQQVGGMFRISTGDALHVFYAAPGSFAGFVSTGGAIQSVTITSLSPSSSGLRAAAESIVVGVVPAPGGLAVVGLASFGWRRRRSC